MTKKNKTIISSIVHGYKNLKKSLNDIERPSLLVIKNKQKKILKYIYPRNPSDFREIKNIISGEIPSIKIQNFKKLPRFGLTGLCRFKDRIYSGSWNSIYQINSKSFKLEKIITNRLMCDIHGIYVNKNFILHVLTAKDTVVFTGHDGKIKDFFTVGPKLNIFKDNKLLKDDWRFISKQYKGSTGFFHFNYIQYDNKKNELFLTSRNLNCIVVVNLQNKKAKLKTMNLSTPALIHDGVIFKNKYYFTSVDGKILIAKQASKNIVQHNRESIKNINKFNRDLIVDIIRLNDKKILNREPNWCRGISVNNKHILLNIDGRYDTKLKYSVIKLNKNNFKFLEKYDFKWSEAGLSKNLRYCTGFDVIEF